MAVFSKRWPTEFFWKNAGGQPKYHIYYGSYIHQVDRKKGQWGNRLASCICVTYIPKWVFKDLPRNLPFPLLTLQSITSRNDVCSKGQWCVCVPWSSHCCWVEHCATIIFFKSSSAKMLSTKQNEKPWEAYGRTAKGLGNSCLELTDIASVSLPFQW